MPSNSGVRAATCFTAAEIYALKGEKEVAAACYLEGLRILNEEAQNIAPLDFIRLCVTENHVLIAYFLPA